MDYVARQLGVEAGELAGYERSGSTFQFHRAQIRRYLGFRRFSEDDEAKFAGWLAEEVAAAESSDERLREALLARCREQGIEPPARVDRIIGAARAAVTDRFTAATVARLSPATITALEALVGIGPAGAEPAGGAWLAELKADPGKVGRGTVTGELAKLARVRALGLPNTLGDVTVAIDTAAGTDLIVTSDERVSITAAAARADADREPIGSEAKHAAMIRMKHGELAARNRPGGYWIAASDPLAATRAVTGTRRPPVCDARSYAATASLARFTWRSQTAGRGG